MFGSKSEEGNQKGKPGGNLHNHFGEGTVVHGEVRSPNNIRVDGVIVGTVQSDARIIIGSNGKVEGDIICENADVSGKVYGKVEVKDLLQLTRTALIEGDIISDKLVVEAGAKFTGTCNMSVKAQGAKLLNEDKGNIRNNKEEEQGSFQKKAV